MNNCNECMEMGFPHFKVVANLSERNSIPCDQRVDGMLVNVRDLPGTNHKIYMLKGDDICNNGNWKEYNTLDYFRETLGHVIITEQIPTDFLVTSPYLNTRFPKAESGFRVTYTELNTSFMKLDDGNWVLTNYIKI